MTDHPTPLLLNELLHPVRMRILLAFAGSSGQTPLQLAERLNDVPQATLYRQIGRLAKAGILTVIEERPVRGTVEKVYALSPTANLHLDAESSASLSKEEHLRYFNAFTVTLMDEFARYLNHTPHPDLAADGVGYTQVLVEMSDEELITFSTAINQALMPYLNGQENPQRKRRIFSTVLMPEISGISQSR